MGRCKSLGSLKSFLCYAPQLSGASFHILSFLRAHWLTLEGCNRWWLWHSLFTDMARNTPFITFFLSIKHYRDSEICFYSSLQYSVFNRGNHNPEFGVCPSWSYSRMDIYIYIYLFISRIHMHTHISPRIILYICRFFSQEESSTCTIELTFFYSALFLLDI